jgi:hypothetical protein
VTSERFGSVEQAAAAGLALRYDGGPCFRCGHYQAEIDHLGLARSRTYHSNRKPVAASSASWACSNSTCCGSSASTPRGVRALAPGVWASLREGLAETVTLQRRGVHQQLWKTLSSTNPIESMIGICRATSRKRQALAKR